MSNCKEAFKGMILCLLLCPVVPSYSLISILSPSDLFCLLPLSCLKISSLKVCAEPMVAGKLDFSAN